MAHVERAVKRVLHENDVFTVSLLTNSLSIIPYREIENEEEFNEFEKKLKKAIEAAGYRLLCEEEKKENKDEKEPHDLIRLFISAFFTLCVMYLSMGGMLKLPVRELRAFMLIK